jgi:hypothetical protein
MRCFGLLVSMPAQRLQMSQLQVYITQELSWVVQNDRRLPA